MKKPSATKQQMQNEMDLQSHDSHATIDFTFARQSTALSTLTFVLIINIMNIYELFLCCYSG